MPLVESASTGRTRHGSYCGVWRADQASARKRPGPNCSRAAASPNPEDRADVILYDSRIEKTSVVPLS